MRQFLEDLTAHHANGLPKDAEADCLELANSSYAGSYT